METSSPEDIDRKQARNNRGHDAGENRGDIGRLELRMDRGKHFRQEPVARHGEKDPRLAHEQDQNHRAQSPDGADLDERPEPRKARSRRVHGNGDGVGNRKRVYLTMPVVIPATRMKSTVQMAREPRMPIGMSRWGFFASCAAVETASKPM